MQTPYEQLPTVLTVQPQVTDDETYDSLVRTVAKRTGLQTALSLNIPTQLLTQNHIILGKLISDEIMRL